MPKKPQIEKEKHQRLKQDKQLKLYLLLFRHTQ